ncbi:putative zinc protease [bacterium HR30]|nr:putative zinc protease [bacterium HR30]
MKVPQALSGHRRTRSRNLVQTDHRGLRLTAEHHRGPLTALALSIRAGARFDGPHPGLAHAVEHMMFQGTKNLDQRALTELAAQLGGQHNAVTRYETITLTFECFNQDAERALWLLAEQYYNTVVDEQRWKVERRVVLDELRGYRSDPVHTLEESAFCRFFRGALAHPIAGTSRSLANLNAKAIRAFLKRHFVHGATSLAIAGGADPERILQTAERLFWGEPTPAPPPPPVAPGQSGILRRRQHGTVGYVTFLIEAPASFPDFFAAATALEVLGDAPDTRLFQEIRGRRGLGYAVDTGSAWGPDWALFTIGASCPRGDVGRLRDTIETICNQASESGFTQEEFDRARKKLRFAYALLEDSLLDRAVTLAEDRLLGFPLPEEVEVLIANLSRDEVSQAWRQVWQGRRLTALLM